MISREKNDSIYIYITAILSPSPPIPGVLLGVPCILLRLGRRAAQLGVELPGPPGDER